MTFKIKRYHIVKIGTVFRNGWCGGAHLFPRVTVLLDFWISYIFYLQTRKLIFKLGPKNLNLKTWFWVTDNTLKKIHGNSFIKINLINDPSQVVRSAVMPRFGGRTRGSPWVGLGFSEYLLRTRKTYWYLSMFENRYLIT